MRAYSPDRKPAEIRVWPLDLGHLSKEDIKVKLDRAEYSLFVKVIEESSFKAVLKRLAEFSGTAEDTDEEIESKD